MTLRKTLGAMVALSTLTIGGAAFAEVSCGANTGEAATGAPILVGGIHGNAAPGDFSSSTDSAGAYFRCVNANGGINGRPIEYAWEDDQTRPRGVVHAEVIVPRGAQDRRGPLADQ